MFDEGHILRKDQKWGRTQLFLRGMGTENNYFLVVVEAKYKIKKLIFRFMNSAPIKLLF